MFFDVVWVKLGMVGLGFQENGLKIGDAFVDGFVGLCFGAEVHLLVQEWENNFFLKLGHEFGRDCIIQALLRCHGVQ